MKLDARKTAAFLRDPGPVRIVLLHGDDEGLVRQRADALTKSIVGARDDPFRVAWLAREDHARVSEEASAIAMLGGRRVVRVRDAADALAPSLAAIAAEPGDSLIVVEAAGGLPARSKLRVLVEALPNGAVIACYPEEGRALQDRIASTLRDAGIAIDQDAVAYVADRMGADSAAVIGEIDKLILYAGDAKRLDLDEIRLCVGDAASVAFDDAVFAASAGDAPAADRAVELAIGEGAAPVAITRGVLQHLAKLHLARGHMAAGMSEKDAVGMVRPPIFFKRLPDFTRALRRWDLPRLTHAMTEARRVELLCKQTGSPDTLLVRRLLLALARQAARAA